MITMATDVVPSALPNLQDRTLNDIAALSEALAMLARIVPGVTVAPEPKFNSTI
jgi:hypothetical protein